MMHGTSVASMDGPVDGPVMGQAGRSDVSGSRCFGVDEEEVGNRLIVLHILHDLLFVERHSRLAPGWPA